MTHKLSNGMASVCVTYSDACSAFSGHLIQWIMSDRTNQKALGGKNKNMSSVFRSSKFHFNPSNTAKLLLIWNNIVNS